MSETATDTTPAATGGTVDLISAPGPATADEDPGAVYLASLESDESRRTMRAALEAVVSILTDGQRGAAGFPWWLLERRHTAFVRAELARRYDSPASANNRLSALKGVLRECERMGYMSAEQCRRASDLKQIRGQREPSGRRLTTGELRALFDATDDGTNAGARDAAAFALLFAAGLRRSELVALDLEDVREADDGLEITIQGKGNKQRTVPLSNGSRDALEHWLDVRGREPGPLITRVLKGGRVVLSRITTAAVFAALNRRADAARIDRLSPHDLRRTCITTLLERDVDVLVTQRLAGHANAATTAKYDRRGREAERKAADVLSVPYKRG